MVKKPQIPEFWSHGGNKGISLCLQLLQKTEHELNVTKNCSHHQTNHDKTILFPLNKSSPQSAAALPGNPSCTKGFCQLHHCCSHRGSGNLELQTQLQKAVLLWAKKYLTAGKDNSSNTGILQLKALHFHKRFYSHYKKKGGFDFFDIIHELLPLS